MSSRKSGYRELGATAPSSQGRLAAFLSEPILLEEIGPSRVLLHLVALIGFAVIGFIVWASITNLNETSKTAGQILPSSAIYVVQHLEGGIVDSIRVQEGEIVEAGQVLVTLSPAATRSELLALEARRAALALSTRRLRAFASHRSADFDGFSGYVELVADQRSLLAAQVAARDDQLDVLQSQLDQRRVELEQVNTKEANLKLQTEIISEQLTMLEQAMSGQAVSRFEYLDTQAELARVQGDREGAAIERDMITDAIAEAERQILELDSRLRSEALTELNNVSAQLREVEEALGELKDREARLDIRSPHDGVVKGLEVKTVGGVIEPGLTLMEIVPLDETMVAEVQIPPSDIGHVKVGQRADVAITTYDTKQFGLLEGKVRRISASSFVTEKGEPYYVGIIELAKNHVGTDATRYPILPGMVVNADIQTGRKTLLRYLIKPVDRALRASFSER